MQRVMQDGALSRFRVIDFSQARAGPICVMQLADFGADVLKVEAPAHTPRQELYIGERDGADMQNLHRNKRSITLDLKAAAARVILQRLIATADVVVENFRPDVKTRLGLDYDTLHAIDPRIVLVSISGFGQDGPYRSRPGFDQILQGMCGLMSTTGEPGGTPMRAGAAVIDVSTGLYAAIGALTALLEREVSGRGQWVRTSLLHAGIGLMDFQAARYLVDRTVAGRTGNDHPTSMPTSAYPTRDGWINVGAGSEAMWTRLCAALGEPSLATADAFRDNAARIVHRDRLNAALGGLLRTRTTSEWVEAFEAADVPCGPVYTMDQVFADPQVGHCGIAARVDHPRRGPIDVIAPVVSLDRTPGRVAATIEDRGGSTEAVLEELGFGVAEVRQFRADGAIWTMASTLPGTDRGTTPSLDVDGAVATITLRRPARANRLEAADLATLEAHCATLHRARDVRAVIVTATGKHFSGGFDLEALAASLADPHDRHDGRDAPGALSSMIDALQAVPQVTICALNGGVFGGATEFALACDFRIGTPGTRLRMPAAALGLHYPTTGLMRFVSRLGLQATRRIFLLAESHDAEALLRTGYLDAIVPLDRLMDEARAWAANVASLAPLATRAMKATLDALANGTLDATATARAEVACLQSTDLREGIESARHKRAARFTGH